jgi:hypothetical protein
MRTKQFRLLRVGLPPDLNETSLTVGATAPILPIHPETILPAIVAPAELKPVFP